ncbi:MAG: hypothetical protein J0L61_03915 [Planctomycetes bacterium]|nr:hypothetical protein [Planctomycetota bacterium]
MPGWLSRLIEREKHGFLRHLRRPTKWNAKHCPEIKHFGSEGADLHTAYVRLWIRVCSVALPILMVIMIVDACASARDWFVSRYFGSAPQNVVSALVSQWSSYELFAGALILGLAASMIGIPFGRHIERRYLRYRLRERGVILCIPCGHDMTGTGVERCAECGKPLALRRPAGEP